MAAPSLKTKSKSEKKTVAAPVRVLGIDPGFGRMGYGVVEEHAGEIRAVTYGCFETKKSETIAVRLLELKGLIDTLVREAKPTVVGIETLFFSKNVKTAIAVGEARGVILYSIADQGLPIFELSPQQVKQAVTGYGNADKRQVQKMVQTLLDLKKPPTPDDASDALAIAIATAHLRRFLTKL